MRDDAVGSRFMGKFMDTNLKKANCINKTHCGGGGSLGWFSERPRDSTRTVVAETALHVT